MRSKFIRAILIASAVQFAATPVMACNAFARVMIMYNTISNECSGYYLTDQGQEIRAAIVVEMVKNKNAISCAHDAQSSVRANFPGSSICPMLAAALNSAAEAKKIPPVVGRY